MSEREQAVVEVRPAAEVRFGRRLRTAICPPSKKKTGADSIESAPAAVVSLDPFARLEREADAEFAPDCERDDGAAWVDEARGMAKR